MITNAFAGRTERPSEADLAEALGPAKSAWDRLVAELAYRYEAGVHEWKSHSPKWGWALRILRKKRTIVWLSPARSSFEVLFILGDKAITAARSARLSQRILHAIACAPKYPEGTGVRLAVKSARDVAGILKLAAIKVSN